jgi:sugar/nucleoside kinase (ribokinase family)
MTKVVLVIGACGLDRLLSVASFPEADTKVRTTAYHEIGGGNAANTAHTMALLKDATFLKDEGIVVKLLSKVGDDSIGRQLARELHNAGVDLTSPLFRYGHQGSTTSFTTIIVSDSEFTRTCIHTPGTCGPLTLDDVNEVDMDQVFQDVVHVQSDCRYADVSLVLAREARRRGVSFSVDPEKDRMLPEQDELLELATTVFLNSQQMHSYFERRTTALEAMHGREALPKPKVKCRIMNSTVTDAITNSIRPPAFYLRWHGESQLAKDFVITKGCLGAIHVQPKSFRVLHHAVSEPDGVMVHIESNGDLQIDCNVSDGSALSLSKFDVQTCGVLTNATIVDTTGAGDVFIAGYLLVSLTLVSGASTSSLALAFGNWVAGKKLQQPGARLSLQGKSLVDDELGHSRSEVENNLKKVLRSFGAIIE